MEEFFSPQLLEVRLVQSRKSEQRQKGVKKPKDLGFPNVLGKLRIQLSVFDL